MGINCVKRLTSEDGPTMNDVPESISALQLSLHKFNLPALMLNTLLNIIEFSKNLFTYSIEFAIVDSSVWLH